MKLGWRYSNERIATEQASGAQGNIGDLYSASLRDHLTGGKRELAQCGQGRRHPRLTVVDLASDSTRTLVAEPVKAMDQSPDVDVPPTSSFRRLRGATER